MTNIRRNPLLPLGWPDKIAECEGDENCNTVYRSVVSCLGLEGLDQLRTSKLSLGLVQRCGNMLQNIVNSRSDMGDLAIDFFITMNYIDNVLNEPLDIYTATRRLVSAVKTMLSFAEKSRNLGDLKTAEFVLNVLNLTIYGIMDQYLEEKKDPLVRKKVAELANMLTSLASTTSSSTSAQGSAPDWW